MLGVGGGILFVPALVIVLDEPQLRAESTSLLAIVPVALAGTWRQHGYGNVNLRDAAAIGVLSPLGVLAGVAGRERRLRADARGLVRGPDPVRRGSAVVAACDPRSEAEGRIRCSSASLTDASRALSR